MSRFKIFWLSNKKSIITTFIFILLISGCVLFYFLSDENKVMAVDNDIVSIEKEEDSVPLENDSSEDEKLIFVDIKGSVKKPGVYSFNINGDYRVNDVINMAGGLTKNADTSLINLAMKINDEMSIMVYSKSDLDKVLKAKESLCTSDNDACIKEKTQNTLININTSSLEEIMTISGIGESKALAIIDYRNTYGNFKSIDELLNVSGIGESVLEKIRKYITI